MMQIAILLFPGAAAVDVTGPCAVMGRLSGAEVCFVAEHPGMLASDDEAVTLAATRCLTEVTAPDILFVPGGPGVKDVLAQETVLAWIATADLTSRWTLAVRSGSRLLAAAGVLDDEVPIYPPDGVGPPPSPPPSPSPPSRPASLPIVQGGRIATTYGPLPPRDIAVAFAAHIMGAEVALLTLPPRTDADVGPPPFIPDDPSGLSLVPRSELDRRHTPEGHP